MPPITRATQAKRANSCNQTLVQQQPYQYHQHHQHYPQPHKQHRHHSQNFNWPMPDIIVGGNYRLLGRIGSGSFGELYRAVGIHHGEEVAVKLESATANHPQLHREAKVYSVLKGKVGFPRIHYFGREGVYNVMVIDLLGPTLEDLFNFCARTFTVKTTLMLADQILSRVEIVHMNCMLHRDIKPENFLMGLGRHRTRVYMIDFGLAKKYYSPGTCQHIIYSERHELVGTARYASTHAHYAEQGRRDDLESVGYLLLYFILGQLPWQGIRAETRQQKYEKIAIVKSSMPLDVLCAGVPYEFYMYLRYCRALNFNESPDYLYLRQLFKELYRNRYMLYDYIYDWVDMKLLAYHNKHETARYKQRQRHDKANQICHCSYHRQQQQRQQQRHMLHVQREQRWAQCK